MAMTPLPEQVRSQPRIAINGDSGNGDPHDGTPMGRVVLFSRAALANRAALPNRAALANRAALPDRAALARGVALAAFALLAAACGSTAAPSNGAAASNSAGSSSSSVSPGSAGTSSAGPTSMGTASAAKVSLDVTFSAGTNTPTAHYTLRCEPAGGTVTDPAAACARLLTGMDIFAPRPAHMLCPMIMTGAGRAVVTGTYLGQNVHVTLVDGGCDLSRWSKLKSIFG